MRPIPFLLALCAVAAAEQSYLSAVRAFEKARAQLREPGVQARVMVALDDLVATHDKRAARPLAALVVESMVEEDAAFERIKEIQREGARAHERMEELDREIRHLKLKERAGDRTAGPEIQKRVDETDQMVRLFDDVKQRIQRRMRLIEFLREVRERAVKGAATVVAKQTDPASAREAIGFLFEALDVAKREQGLFLVRALDESKNAEAEPYFVRILEHPKASPGVQRKACYALAGVLGRAGADALVAVVRRDPDGLGSAALHALSLAARRRLADVEQAAEFAKSLP